MGQSWGVHGSLGIIHGSPGVLHGSLWGYMGPSADTWVTRVIQAKQVRGLRQTSNARPHGLEFSHCFPKSKTSEEFLAMIL